MNEIRLGTGVLDPKPTPTATAVRAVPVRRRLLAGAAVVSPLALAAQYALDPTGMLPRDDADALLGAIAESPGQYLASSVVFLVGMITLVAWALTLFAALHERIPRLAATAATMLTLAAIGGAGFAGLRLAACSFVDDGEVTTGAVEIWTRLQGGPVFAVLTPLLVMTILGSLLAGIALIRVRSEVTVWAGPLYLAGFVLGSGEFPVAFSIAGGLLQAVAVLLVARLAVRR
ncbi:hypothetical protein GON03_00530 [Nocardioides sp. MAH-18]|uniref:DUF4386 family protein n=1 Tax=Nocardioides agri TaxID=2682843 RepID=A0A6L6XL31_9ACTN|nr:MULTISPECIES: hypothetical protein [unclassified Nocardioides]MBA2956501.1 hypothetical protein [Nocardioides sp. CGMCC 1.13656]MVQ47648.1 hypothetical protein [Nocardioides sp. MAH-18]